MIKKNRKIAFALTVVALLTAIVLPAIEAELSVRAIGAQAPRFEARSQVVFGRMFAKDSLFPVNVEAGAHHSGQHWLDEDRRGGAQEALFLMSLFLISCLLIMLRLSQCVRAERKAEIAILALSMGGNSPPLGQ